MADGNTNVPVPVTDKPDRSQNAEPETTEELSHQSLASDEDKRESENCSDDSKHEKAPRCLIKTDSKNRLTINEEVLAEIASTDKHLNVVSIVGLYRTGKSYLLTRLAGQYKGFPLGSTIESQTKGIWAWCLDHPVHKDQKLLLLDTEGLGDVTKGDTDHDNQLFALACLLSSTVVYNTKGVFDQNTLEQLNFITEMSKHIRISQDNSKADEELVNFVPKFILTMRDCCLELKVKGLAVTSDEYLDHCLTCRPVSRKGIDQYNESRNCIKSYFETRKCFVFCPPTASENMAKLEQLLDTDLSKAFVKEVELFTNYVWHDCEPLMFKGARINGRMFECLVREYVTAIKNGAMPCVESALKSMTIIENGKAAEKSVDVYMEEMNSKLKLPTADNDELSHLHAMCKKVAFDAFNKHSILDKESILINREKAAQNILKEYSNIKEKNNRESAKQCNRAIEVLYKDIKEKMKTGEYCKAGGSSIYNDDMKQLEESYDSMTGLGVMKPKMYAQFCEQTRQYRASILTADRLVTKLEEDKQTEQLKAENAVRNEKLRELENGKLKAEHNQRELELKEEMSLLEERNKQNMDLMKQRVDNNEKRHADAIARLEKKNHTTLTDLNDKINQIREEKETLQIEAELQRKCNAQLIVKINELGAKEETERRHRDKVIDSMKKRADEMEKSQADEIMRLEKQNNATLTDLKVKIDQIKDEKKTLETKTEVQRKYNDKLAAKINALEVKEEAEKKRRDEIEECMKLGMSQINEELKMKHAKEIMNIIHDHDAIKDSLTEKFTLAIEELGQKIDTLENKKNNILAVVMVINIYKRKCV